jgi:subtilase family serine protease
MRLPQEALRFGGGSRPSPGFARPPFHLHPDVNSSKPAGLSPIQVRHAYGFDRVANQGAGQTIAIIDAYDDPNIASDLAVFSSTFGLPTCSTANGCFRKVYASGFKPQTDAGWSLEIALDVEWAHAMAPQAKIVLVEANSSSFADLMRAVDTAVGLKANVISMSFGGSEFSSETSSYYDGHFNNSNTRSVTFLASSGDNGSGAEYPAASPYVIAVGGTTLSVDSVGNYLGETAWSGSGGALSAYEAEPAGQQSYPIPRDNTGTRGIPDVSYNGNPNTGFPVYDTVPYYNSSGWFTLGGTSAGAPQWASLVAIVNSARAAAGKLPLTVNGNLLYNSSLAGSYRDISSGTNGTCGTICTSSSGYDYVTGLGSPDVANLVPAMLRF